MKTRIKAARILAGMTQAELCEAAEIPLITLRRVEGRPDHKGLVSEDTVTKIQHALEDQGIQFLCEGDTSDGEGVALRRT